MEDNLNFSKMEDDANFFEKGRRLKYFQMEDYLNIWPDAIRDSFSDCRGVDFQKCLFNDNTLLFMKTSFRLRGSDDFKCNEDDIIVEDDSAWRTSYVLRNIY